MSETRPPLAPIGTSRRSEPGLGSFVSAVGPMILVELTLLIVLLLVEPHFAVSQTSALPFTKLDNQTLLALAASTIVFPVLLQPLVQASANTFDRLGSIFSPKIAYEDQLRHTLDDELLRKFGFALSDFSQELDAVLDQSDQERLGWLRTRMERQRLRASSYLLSLLPLAATVTILWDRYRGIGVIAADAVWLMALILYVVALRDGRRTAADYWSMQGSLAVQHRFDIVRSLSLRPPMNLADERQLWKTARTVTLSASDLLSPSSAEDGHVAPTEARRIRYAYEPPSGIATDSPVTLPEEPWVVEYDGFVSATWRTVPGSTADHGKADLPTASELTVTIDRTEHGSNSERISVGGRRAPYAEFRVVPDSDDVDVAPSELVLRPSSDSAATGTFTTTRRRLGHYDPRLWVRVYQHKRLVATLAVDLVTGNGGQD